MGRFESGVAALAFLDAGLPVDVVFTDIVMPGGMDGIDLAVVVRLRWPATGLLLTSAHVDLARRREFENVLADVERLAKPFQLPGLITRHLRLGPPHFGRCHSAIEDILDCRTAALGGQVWRCDTCGAEAFSFHPRGNRRRCRMRSKPRSRLIPPRAAR
jgi:CheY-like chemotaxis protein